MSDESIDAIMDRVLAFEADHGPDGYPPITMRDARRLVDEIEALRSAAYKVLPADRALTQAEAELAYVAAPSVPVSPAEIDRIVEYATRKVAAPGGRPGREGKHNDD